MSLPDKVELAIRQIEREFYIDDGYLIKASDYFLQAMDAGLKAPKQSRENMPMIPAHVSKIPTGKETGLFLAADLGGTNFRVCSIDLKGDHTFELKQSKYRIPPELMKCKKLMICLNIWLRKLIHFLKNIIIPPKLNLQNL